MTQNRSRYEFYQESTMSQKLAAKIPRYQKLAGADRELSESIGILLVLCDKGLLNKEDPNIKLMLALLDVQRMAAFATSERTNEITKMGMQMPRGESIIEIDENDDED